MGRARNLSKLTIDKDKIDTPSLHNALTAICDEPNTKNDYLQLPHDDGTSKGELGATRFKGGEIETHNGVLWSSHYSKTETLHSVKGLIVSGYSTKLSFIFDSDEAQNDIVFYQNAKEIFRKTFTNTKGTGVTATMQTTSALYSMPYNAKIDVFLESQNFTARESFSIYVKHAGSGGTVSNKGLAFTHVFTNDGIFEPYDPKVCDVAVVGGGGGGGKGVYDHEASGFTANHVSGGGGGGGHLTEWSGIVNSNTSIAVASGGRTDGYDGGASSFGSVKAGGGGGGGSYNDDANSGSGGGGGGGASDTYDRGAWRSTVNHKPPATGETKGGWGDGGRKGGGGGGGNKPNDAPNNSGHGGSATYSSIIGDSVGGGGYGGYSHNDGRRGDGAYGKGGGGGGDTSGSSGTDGVVVVKYTISD